MPVPLSSVLSSALSPLVARDVSKSYGDLVVLDGIDLVANPGLPLGIVGENGAGKSSLLRLLAGAQPLDSGSVARPADLGHLGQEPDFPSSASVGDVLDAVLAPLHESVARLEGLAGRLEDPDAAEEYVGLLAWAELHDAWDADRRASVAAHRLGLGLVDRARPVAAMSGGQRSRLALAALVTRRPACVLLDEPTNHLDDDAVAFLEAFLRDLPGIVVVASHDRVFLDNVASTIVDLDPTHLGVDGMGGNRFTGGYTSYLTEKQAARGRWEVAFGAQQDELNRLRDAARTTARSVGYDRPASDGDKFIYHFKGGNVARTVSRRVRDNERRIEIIERDPIPKPPNPLTFSATFGGRPTPAATISVRDLVVPGRLSLPRLDVQPGGHMLVTGANGSGKSTLLKVLAGLIDPVGDSVHVSARAVGYLPQDTTFTRPDRTAQQVYDDATGPTTELARLGLLHPRDLSRPVGVLSLGQQRRLALAVIVARRPDLLLLDEPTNHISLALADELEEAIGAARSTVVVASHDRWLRRRWTGESVGL